MVFAFMSLEFRGRDKHQLNANKCKIMTVIDKCYMRGTGP